ncbi:MAG: hypothetical protein EAZ89_14495 [Bacteroidetes bacterium]|nr:MAG: hypothetical protein EAZ89_14495 [Bacteroidota bacterium]
MSNGSDLLLRNALAVDPRSPFDGSRVDILIKGERISKIGPAGTLLPESETCVYEADNLHVSPGWTDMLACLNQPGHEYKETLSQLSQAAVKGGFAQVLCHPHTQPVADNSQMIRSLSLQASGLPAQLLFCGTVSAGGEGKNLAELVDMSEAGATAFSDHIDALDKLVRIQRQGKLT